MTACKFEPLASITFIFMNPSPLLNFIFEIFIVEIFLEDFKLDSGANAVDGVSAK